MSWWDDDPRERDRDGGSDGLPDTDTDAVPGAPMPPTDPALDPRLRVGAFLRRERVARQLSLEELAQTTRIPLRTLELIETGRFEELPGDVFARGFLKSYARVLGLPEEEVLGRYDGIRGTMPPEPVTRPSVLGAPERESGFGIAIALVILLVLFTLALSIVLRPRRRDAPVELSAAPTQVLDVVPGPTSPPRSRPS